MSNKQASDGEAGRGMSRAGRRAWAGRAILALVPLVATGHQMLQLRAEEEWREFSEDLRRAPLQETRQALDAGIEGAFAPVYAAIPSLLDWHYSFIGQYAELGLALTGRLQEEIELRLFGELAEGISGVKTLTRGLAEKLAGGAALRAAGPLLGRAARLIVAAAAGVGIDIALRKLDELLNRDELEQALAMLVDEEKERVTAALESAVDEVKVTALGDFVPSRLR